jgi:hypothetical protein
MCRESPIRSLAPGAASRACRFTCRFPEPNPCLNDPAGRVRDKVGEFMWSKQREIADGLVKYCYVTVKSCHDSGTSHCASRIVWWWLDIHEDPLATTTAPTAMQANPIL